MQVRRRLTYRIDAYEEVGERLRVDGHLSRIGLQTYSDGFGGEQIEYRPPEEVFDEDSLRSLRGMPVTIRHPRDFVTPTNWQDHAVGHVDEVGRADDGVHVRGSVWLHRHDAIADVKAGDLVELSVGYTAWLDMTPGTYEGQRYDAVQRDIRGNHLALLAQGEARGGPTVRLRLDAAGHQVIPLEDQWHDQRTPRQDGGKNTEGLMAQKVRADGLEFELEAPPQFFDALDRERAETARQVEDLTKAKADAEAKAAEAAKKIDELEAELAEANDPARFDARLKLIEDARKLGGAELDVTGSDAEIKRRALDAAGLTDLEDAHVDGAFISELRHAAASEETSHEDAQRDSVRGARRAAVGVGDEPAAYRLDDEREW